MWPPDDLREAVKAVKLKNLSNNLLKSLGYFSLLMWFGKQFTKQEYLGDLSRRVLIIIDWIL